MHEFAQNARSNKFIFYRYMSKQLENGWLTLNLTSWYDNRRKLEIWYDNRRGPSAAYGIEMRMGRRPIRESVSYAILRVHFYVGDF